MIARFGFENSGLESPCDTWLAASTGFDVPSGADVGPSWVDYEAVETADACRAPVFLPDHYEPNYAYPLIVWLRGAGQAPFDLVGTMSGISERNYLGLEIDEPVSPVANAALTEDLSDDLSPLEQQVWGAVAHARQLYHVHGERVFIAGFDRGGALALQLGLARPEWFAGIIAVNSPLPRARCLLRRFRDLRGKRLLLASRPREIDPSIGETGDSEPGAAEDRGSPAPVALARLLHGAGLRVCSRTYAATPQWPARLWSDMDRWIMREIYAVSAPCS